MLEAFASGEREHLERSRPPRRRCGNSIASPSSPFARELGPSSTRCGRPSADSTPTPRRCRWCARASRSSGARSAVHEIATPYFRDLGRAGRQLANAGPDTSSTFLGLNRLFNIGAFNRGGAEGLTGNLASDRARDEGYLYWLAWTAQNTVASLFSTGDAQGNFRRIHLGGFSCGLLGAFLSGSVPGLGSLPPAIQALVTDIIDGLGEAGVCAHE